MNKNIIAACLMLTAFLFSGCTGKQDTSPASSSARPDSSKETDTLAFGDKNWIGNGLEGKIYYLPENTSSLPLSFDTMKVQGTIYTKTVDVPERSWSSGFPGVGNRFEWFAIVYKGTFRAKKAGHYTFRLYSDDGAKLYIDDSLVVNNDGEHPAISAAGPIDLDRSDHRVTIQYFQGPRFYVALQLFEKLGNEDEQIFPGNYFTVSTPGSCGCGWWVIWVVLAGILVVVVLIRRLSKKRAAEI